MYAAASSFFALLILIRFGFWLQYDHNSVRSVGSSIAALGLNIMRACRLALLLSVLLMSGGCRSGNVIPS